MVPIGSNSQMRRRNRFNVSVQKSLRAWAALLTCCGSSPWRGYTCPDAGAFSARSLSAPPLAVSCRDTRNWRTLYKARRRLTGPTPWNVLRTPLRDALVLPPSPPCPSTKRLFPPQVFFFFLSSSSFSSSSTASCRVSALLATLRQPSGLMSVRSTLPSLPLRPPPRDSARLQFNLYKGHMIGPLMLMRYPPTPLTNTHIDHTYLIISDMTDHAVCLTSCVSFAKSNTFFPFWNL